MIVLWLFLLTLIAVYFRFCNHHFTFSQTELDDAHVGVIRAKLNPSAFEVYPNLQAVVGTDLLLSPRRSVNMDYKSRELANVPLEAVAFSWCNAPDPLIPFEELPMRRSGDPNVAFLYFGGFVYFDLQDRVVGVSATVLFLFCLCLCFFE
jgi:hypothetical protein